MVFVTALAWCLCADARPAVPSGSGALPVAPISALPAVARQTLERIQEGGPYPYARDGAVFGNYERLLPAEPRGYYREYTVPQPSSRNRGTRRLIVGCTRGHSGTHSPMADHGTVSIAGCNGPAEIYYTEDHYRSFQRVVP
jgi:ribonuclease T1